MQNNEVKALEVAIPDREPTFKNKSASTHITMDFGTVVPGHFERIYQDTEFSVGDRERCILTSLVAPCFGDLSLKSFSYFVPFSALTRNYSAMMAQQSVNRGASTFVPHADDDLIGGYALAKLQKDNLRYVYFGYTGSKKSIQIKKIRTKEFKKYSEYMDIGAEIVFSGKDLKVLIDKYNVKTIYLPSMIDWHDEHRMVNYQLYDSLSNMNLALWDDIEIIWYSITVPIGIKKQAVVYMTKKDQKEKYDIFSRIYKSQAYMPVDRFKFQERLNVNGTGFYAGETYAVLNVHDWKKMVEIVRNDIMFQAELNKLKNYIDRMLIVRKKSEELYNRLLCKAGIDV